MDFTKIDTEHPDYTEWKDIVTFVRTAVEGSRAVKKSKTLFLPKTEGMKKSGINLELLSDEAINACGIFDPYAEYLERAYWVPATGDANDAIADIINSKAPVYSEGVEVIEDFLKNLDGKGGGVRDIIRESASEVTQAIRYIGFVNYSTSTEGMTVSQAESIWPNLTFYKFEDMINWGTHFENGKEVVDWVVLKETALIPGEDGFSQDEVTYYTFPHINESGYYEIRYFMDDGKGNIVEREDKPASTPKKQGKNITEIPIWVLTAFGNSFNLFSPMMEKPSYMNKSHYINSADLEIGLFKTANPTFFGKGLGEQDVIMLGANGGIISENSESDVKYLEFNGAGLGALETRMNAKIEDMARYVAGLFMDSKTDKTATESLIDSTANFSSIASLASAIEQMLNEMIQYALEWKGVDYEFKMTLNKDYVNKGVDAQMLTSLTQALLTGAISFQTYFNKLQEGGIISPNQTQENEESEIEAGGYGTNSQ